MVVDVAEGIVAGAAEVGLFEAEIVVDEVEVEVALLPDLKLDQSRFTRE